MAKPFGDYVLESLLGKGGFGEVWKAQDPSLARSVALKILRHDDPDELTRFLREAHTAASLIHANIAAVYRVGQFDGKHFIAMQLIDGHTLATFPRNNINGVVRVMRDVCRAVAFAHDKDIIHRDLKPANIMVDRDGRAYVMDFGLARQLKPGSSLTVSGMMIGTPAYMSPEQAQGRRADPRSDVYSLGATLYELLTEKPPFQSDDVISLLTRVVAEDPVAPRTRNPRVPRELDTIVLKCLEKDPDRRYATAAALADDLERWLNGEPISAHPPSFVYLLRKRIAKRKWSLLAAAGLVAALAVTATLLPILQSTKKQLNETHARLREQMRDMTDAYLRTVLAERRSGNVRGMLDVVPTAESICRQCADAIPELSEPHARLGRIYRAALRYDDALAELDRALAKNGADADARYERGLLRAQYFDRLRLRYARRYEALPGRPAGHRPTLADLERLNPDLARFRAGAREDMLAAGDRPTIRAVLSWLDENRVEAKRLLEEAIASEPDLEAAIERLGQLALDDERYQDALDLFSRGIESDRGYMPYLQGRGNTLLNRGVDAQNRGEDPTDLYTRAIRDYSVIATHGNDEQFAIMNRGQVRMNLAVYRSERGDDVTDLIREATLDFDHLVKRWPQRFEPWEGRGIARSTHGEILRMRGQEAPALYEQAIADFDKALAIEPDDGGTYDRRANARTAWANLRRDKGEDASGPYVAALQDYEHALQLSPDRPLTITDRGIARTNFGLMMHRRGEDPSDLYAAALRDFDDALQRSPDYDPPRTARAELLVNRLRWDESRGRDVTANYKEVEAQLSAMATRRPHHFDTHRLLGHVRANWASYRQQRLQDPTDLFHGALKSLGQALTIRPGDEVALVLRADTNMNVALFRVGDAEAVQLALAAAISDYTAVLQRNPSRDEAWYGRGYCRSNLSTVCRAQDRDELWNSALDDFERSLTFNPNSAETYRYRGYAYAEHGKHREALDDFEKAIVLNSSLKSVLDGEIADCKARLDK